MLDETRRQPTLRAEALQQPAHTMLSLIECSCGYRNSPSFVRCHVEAANARKTVQEPPTSPQQPAEPAFKDQQRAADSRFIAAHAAYIRNQNETTLYEFTKAGMAAESVQSRETPAEAPQQPAEPTVPPICPACGQAGLLGTICPRCYFGLDAEPTPEAPRQPTEPAPLTLDAFLRKINQNNAEAPQQPAEPAPATERHIDTPDELLELLAGVSSDPQIEGLSLAQKASTMALLYAAKALQVIANVRDQTEDWEKWAVRNPDFARTFAARILDAANSTQEPS